MAELISIREYARRKGCDEKTIRDAIRRGYIVQGVVWPEGGKRQKIDADVADREWAEHFNPARARNHELAAKLTPSEVAPPPPSAPPSSDGLVPGGGSLLKAKTIKEVHAAKLLELKVKQQTGELVKKADVYRELYAYGAEVRRKLEAIPDRIVDEVMAATTRHQVKMIMAGEIEAVLTRITELTGEGGHA